MTEFVVVFGGAFDFQIQNTLWEVLIGPYDQELGLDVDETYEIKIDRSMLNALEGYFCLKRESSYGRIIKVEYHKKPNYDDFDDVISFEDVLESAYQKWKEEPYDGIFPTTTTF